MTMPRLQGGGFALATLAFLALALMLGGSSSGGRLPNLVLQLLGAGLAGWALWQGPIRPARRLPGLGTALAVVALVQFVPLPWALWAALPGRAAAAHGLALLGLHPDGLTLSMAPWSSLAALAQGVAPLAIWLAMGTARAPSPRACASVVVAVAMASLPLALAQRFADSGYLYAITNRGAGPGFFANTNHQSSFLLVALALGAPLAMPHRRQWALAGGAALLAGIAINGSLAVTALVPLALMALALLARPAWRRPPIIAGMAIAALATVTAALFWPGANDLVSQGHEAGIDRHTFLRHGLRMLADTLPLGSGLGSFPQLYPLYENPQLAGPTYANHAHNDLLEWLIETGLFGAWALLAFALWLVARARRLLAGAAGERLALSVGSAALLALLVELAHSLVDYPLRTAALATLFALCCRLVDQGAGEPA